MSYIPSSIKENLVSRLVTLNEKIGFLAPHQAQSLNRLFCVSIYEEIEKGLRECFAREIFSWHDIDCLDTPESCNCTELANLIAGDLLGDEFNIED